VREFVQKQLARYWNDAVPVFPYSVRPGFEHLRAELDDVPAVSSARRSRRAARGHSAAQARFAAGGVRRLLNRRSQGGGVADSEREELRRKILGQKESLDDTRLACGSSYGTPPGRIPHSRRCCEPDELPVRSGFRLGLDQEFPSWTHSLGMATEKFDDWLRAGLTQRDGGTVEEAPRRVRRTGAAHRPAAFAIAAGFPQPACRSGCWRRSGVRSGPPRWSCTRKTPIARCACGQDLRPQLGAAVVPVPHGAVIDSKHEPS
jgi:hypothetical protein